MRMPARKCGRALPRSAAAYQAKGIPRGAPPPLFRKFWKEKLHMFRSNRSLQFRPLPYDRDSCLVNGRGFYLVPLLILICSLAATAQERRNRVDIDAYAIDAEVAPNTQTLTAKATVRFVPLDDSTNSVTFELNNALNVSRVVDDKGKQIPASRNQQDFTVRLSFEQPLAKGQPVTVTFFYDGKLTGSEDSPVYGIKFAAIHPDYAYLLYPARWFPVNGYTTDRFAAQMRITVPMGYTVLGSGIDNRDVQGDKQIFTIKLDRPSFPGSLAIVKGQPAKVASEGVTTSIYFRGGEAEMAQPYGD